MKSRSGKSKYNLIFIFKQRPRWRTRCQNDVKTYVKMCGEGMSKAFDMVWHQGAIFCHWTLCRGLVKTIENGHVKPYGLTRFDMFWYVLTWFDITLTSDRSVSKTCQNLWHWFDIRALSFDTVLTWGRGSFDIVLTRMSKWCQNDVKKMFDMVWQACQNDVKVYQNMSKHVKHSFWQAGGSEVLTSAAPPFQRGTGCQNYVKNFDATLTSFWQQFDNVRDGWRARKRGRTIFLNRAPISWTCDLKRP